MTKTAEYVQDTLLWAKVKGFAWWPAKVEVEADLPAHILKQKPSRVGNGIPVYFFGTREFGWIQPECLKPYKDHYDQFSTKGRTNDFKLAVKEADDPSSWPEKGQFADYEIPAKPEYMDESEDDTPEAPVKEKKVRRKSTPAVSTTAETASKKRKRRVTTNDVDLEKTSSAAKKPKPELNPRDKLARLRMKLQIFLQKKEAYVENDYDVASNFLSETEKVPMDVDLFRETKIGKVIKHLSKKDITQHNISERCKALTERWVAELQGSLSLLPGAAPADTLESGETEMKPVSPKKSVESGAKSETPKSPEKTEVPKSPSKRDLPNSPKREKLEVTAVQDEAPKSPKKVPTSPSKVEESPKQTHDKENVKNPSSPSKSPLKATEHTKSMSEVTLATEDSPAAGSSPKRRLSPTRSMSPRKETVV
ncbi:hypothetical protein HDV02_005920 [Globomyces sp. JEL0801]|nr:hypothetical protein HDV02_005920 [Globomyces sp. JEL0801]